MTNLSFSIQSQIKATVESEKEFSVYFDDAWQWLQYSKKSNAKRVLIANFEEKVDYLTVLNNEQSKDIYLTSDCFKQLAMIAGTPIGKEVRLYYLQCEKELKAIKSNQPIMPNTLIEAVECYLSTLKEKQALMIEASELNSKVVELTPKAENWNRLCGTDGTMTISEVAKNLAISGMGPNNLFKFLREKGIIFYNSQSCNVPKSTLVNKGYMKTVEKYDFKRDKKYSVCVCTYQGYAFIVRCLKRAGYIKPNSPNDPTPNAEALIA